MAFVAVRSLVNLPVSLGLGVVTVALAASCASSAIVPATRVPPPPTPSPSPTATEAPLPVNPAPRDLPVVDYEPLAARLPTDPQPSSTTHLSTGLRPQRRLAVYDAPGGTARAFLEPTIRGVEITLPIVGYRSGWAGVLLPSMNRRIGWLPPGGWTTVDLPDQLVIVRSTHRLLWYRDGELIRSWAVSLGASATPTPLGRTFILGRSRLRGYVYADTAVFALGSVPDDLRAIPPSLRGAHIGIHTWYHDRELGRNTTDGCIRLTKSGQQRLLAELRPGTTVVVVDTLPTPAAGATAAA